MEVISYIPANSSRAVHLLLLRFEAYGIIWGSEGMYYYENGIYVIHLRVSRSRDLFIT